MYCGSRKTRSRLNDVDFVVNNAGPAEEGEHLMTLAPAKFVHKEHKRTA